MNANDWLQAGIIIIFCRLLHYPLSLIRQPRVIAEVIGGIILGPSVMMRIPGFQAAIFPAASMPILNLVANLGLILFLFLVALEVDMRLFMSNWRIALSVGLAGMLLPFGLGCAIAYGLYHQFRLDAGIVPISFGVYMLFIGTALSITAFPVLCRILTELNLLSTPVGVTVLAAGVGNDVVGWVLLALCVALVNNGSGITALYVVLCTIGWVLVLIFAIRPCLLWLLRRTGSIQNGPTQGMVTLILLLTLFSAWFTGIIGVHPIFGGFLVGLICPHDRGFTVKLTEKIEDLVTVLFLPLYFALSGLNTNLGLLNDGISWAYVVGVIAVAFTGKIVGGTLAARSCKLVWRESLTIGVLMSCKGLVELIVLVRLAIPFYRRVTDNCRTSACKPKSSLLALLPSSLSWPSSQPSAPRLSQRSSTRYGTRRSSRPGNAAISTGTATISVSRPTAKSIQCRKSNPRKSENSSSTCA
jgi:Kef-type K+ transport system membrane component KefB